VTPANSQVTVLPKIRARFIERLERRCCRFYGAARYRHPDPGLGATQGYRDFQLHALRIDKTKGRLVSWDFGHAQTPSGFQPPWPARIIPVSSTRIGLVQNRQILFIKRSVAKAPLDSAMSGGELPDPAWQDGVYGSFAATNLLIGIGQNRRRVHRPSQQSFLRCPLPRIVKRL
jgi:hypothetical protein